MNDNPTNEGTQAVADQNPPATQSAPNSFDRKKKILRWTGLVLWLLIFAVAGLLFLRKGDATAPVADATSTDANELTGSTDSDSEASDTPKVLNITEVMRQGGGVVTPVPADQQKPAFPYDEPIRNFSLTERSGQTITRDDLLGRPWVAGFIFTKCAGICPRVSGEMAKLRKRFADEDLRLVSFTVDPERDTPEQLTQYAESFNADPENWLFVTGERDALYDVILHDFKMPAQEVPATDSRPGFEFVHTSNLMLVDEHGVVQGKYNSSNDDEMRDLQQALKEMFEREPADETADTEAGEN